MTDNEQEKKEDRPASLIDEGLKQVGLPYFKSEPSKPSPSSKSDSSSSSTKSDSSKKN